LTSYVVLVFFSDSLWMAVISALCLAQGYILVGFNIMHDGGHGSYSRHPKVNSLMASTLDLLGGSRMLWRQKHNILHHTYTNVDGLDDDLETFGLIRLSTVQQWRFWHRVQHLYAFPLYSLLTLSWVILGDFRKFFTGRIGEYRLQRPSRREKLTFFGGKIFYFGYAVALPLLFHPALYVLSFFLLIHLVIGFTLSLVFQLAHTVEGTSFPTPDPEGAMEHEWSVHQVETTADFAPDNWWATWYLGGLNFQIEHHLFSKVCHIHYPAISEIVRNTCREFGISYTCYPSIRAAVAMHYRFLKELGKRDAGVLQTA
jgi:linoleoyl-CoA desaturase